MKSIVVIPTYDERENVAPMAAAVLKASGVEVLFVDDNSPDGTGAAIDALLGAAALGDIGSHFPDSDPQWKDADSIRMLESVAKEGRRAGYVVANVDATVICERPKLRPVVDLMRTRLAEAMGVGFGRVSVKGKTNEKMDDVGAGVGIEVHAACLLEEQKS